jgi:hypothetical protein
MAPTDYTYPSVYFAYLFFFLSFALAVYFCFRSRKDGYWGEQGEDAKYQMFEDDDPHRRTP